jgi:NADH-quinone oxidoreductase subunit F
VTTSENQGLKDLLEHLLDAEKLKYCFECGICTSSCPMVELFPDHYNPRILIEKMLLKPNEALEDEALWLCAWCYECTKHCPQKVKLPEVFLSLRKIAKEKGDLKGFERAMETIRGEIPFPASFGLVCLHPERVDSALTPPSASPSHRKKTKTQEHASKPDKIAVVGAGPAGLTVATELTRKGYHVTVFESSSSPGGMLKQCIPEHRLPKAVLDAEIEHIRQIGVDIITDSQLGKNLTLDGLKRDGYGAIFISTGAHKSRKLGAEGEDLQGVVQALDFLRGMNAGKTVHVGERVAVIGGGNVAIDVARTSLRLGAKEAHILYRRSKDEMPANPFEIKEAEEDGVKIQFLVGPKKIIGKDGKVTAVECVRMILGEPDETGRRSPKPVEGSEFTLPFDTVVLAIGESPSTEFLPKEVELGEGKVIIVDPLTMETSVPGVFAGGDCVSGPATVVEAVVHGKRAAAHVEEYLHKNASKLTVAQVRKQA